MRVSPSHRFVFISTPKAGTHTIYKVLDDHYSKGLHRPGLHLNEIPDRFREYFRWTVVRNPYTRAVSLWWSGCRLHPPDIYGFRKGCGASDDFTRFVRWLAASKPIDRHTLMKTQAAWLKPCEPILALHLENLEEGVVKLPFWKPGIQLSQLNTTAEKIKVQSLEEGQQIVKPPWEELYKDPLAVEAVVKWAREDFFRFGYPMDWEG